MLTTVFLLCITDLLIIASGNGMKKNSPTLVFNGTSICAHKRTTVKDSRIPGTTDGHGYQLHNNLKYPCLRVRRVTCLDCGDKFKTVEVPQKYMDSMPSAASIKMMILKDMEKFIKERIFK